MTGGRLSILTNSPSAHRGPSEHQSKAVDSGGPEKLRAFWRSLDGSSPSWTRADGESTVTLTEDCTQSIENPLGLPSPFRRRYDCSGTQVDEGMLSISMRVWDPVTLLALVESHGFEVTELCGGYEGEEWGVGRELVVVQAALNAPAGWARGGASSQGVARSLQPTSRLCRHPPPL